VPLSTEQFLALSFDPALVLELSGMKPDQWQRDFLRSQAPRVLLNCCRQAGKSTAVAALALHTALFRPASLVLLLSRTERQSGELFRKVIRFYKELDRPVPSAAESALSLELANGSRVVSLPGNEETIRSFSGVALLVIDEAARVPDELYKAVRPMLAVSRGRLICLSTPFGRQGFFFHAWTGDADWLRFEVPADQVSRISREYLDHELRELGSSWYNQEFLCSFETLEGLVYAEFEQCRVDSVPIGAAPKVGGIDFGVRDPFAAVWGFLDRQDVLWITAEHYQRDWPLDANAAKLPPGVVWEADPAGANERLSLRRADYKVRAADNDIRSGVAAVKSRLQSGRLKALARACPNLVREADLYHYPAADEACANPEIPVDKHNHALDALRYLIAGLDRHFMVRFRRGKEVRPTQTPEEKERQLAKRQKEWLSYRNEALWTKLN
jgi:hypothetical protein